MAEINLDKTNMAISELVTRRTSQKTTTGTITSPTREMMGCMPESDPCGLCCGLSVGMVNDGRILTSDWAWTATKGG